MFFGRKWGPAELRTHLNSLLGDPGLYPELLLFLLSGMKLLHKRSLKSFHLFYLPLVLRLDARLLLGFPEIALVHPLQELLLGLDLSQSGLLLLETRPPALIFCEFSHAFLMFLDLLFKHHLLRLVPLANILEARLSLSLDLLFLLGTLDACLHGLLVLSAKINFHLVP